jgi:hypothetical protein
MVLTTYSNPTLDGEQKKFACAVDEVVVKTVLLDGSGDQITTFGGGTQYTEGDIDATITGNASLFESKTNANKIVAAQGHELTNANAIAVEIVDGSGTQITSFGGGCQYAVDAALGSTPTGTLALAKRDDALSTLTPIEGDAIELRVDANGALWVKHSGCIDALQAGTWNINNISGTISLPTGAATETTLASVIQTSGSAIPSKAVFVGLRNSAGNICGMQGQNTNADGQAVSSAGNVMQAAAFPYLFNGTTWDRALGNSTDGQLVNLGANNDVVVTGPAADGAAISGNPVRIAGRDSGGLTQDIVVGADGHLIVMPDTASITLADGISNTFPMWANEANSSVGLATVPFMFNGTTWDRLRGDATNGLTVNLGANNDIQGDVACDTTDSGNPVKIGGKATNAEPAAVGNNDRVNTYHDLNGYLHNKNHSHLSGETSLADINVVYDDSPTSATSCDICVAGYRWGRFNTILDSTLTPTDIRFIVQSKSGTCYFDKRNGFLGSFLFEDTEIANIKCYSFTFPVVGDDTIRFCVVATGTNASCFFTVCCSTIQLGT